MTKKRQKTVCGRSACLSGHQLTTFVRRFIAGSLADGDSKITSAAKAANLNVRTFQRRLLEAGVTYHQLINEVRLEMAILLLVRTEMTVAEVARDLGYSQPGHFTRAFKRWTAEAPSTVRRRLREGRKCKCR